MAVTATATATQTPGGLSVEQLVEAHHRLQQVQGWLKAKPLGWEPSPSEARVLHDAGLLAKQINQVGKEHPLALTRLWTAHCPSCGREMSWVARGVFECVPCGLRQADVDPKSADCRTSQRAALRDLAGVATLITGSNRAGKTYLG